MKVVILKSRLAHQGGLEKYARRLGKAFAARGCSVTFLSSGEHTFCEGCNVLTFPCRVKPTLWHLHSFEKTCREYLAEHAHDIVFGMDRNCFQTHYRAGNGVHAAYLKQRCLAEPFFKRFTFPLNPLHRTLLSFEKKCFESPDLRLLFTNSMMVKQEILSHYNVPASRVAVVHNGAPYHAWQEEFERKTKSQSFHLLFVGNGFARKGLFFLLQGLSLLKHLPFHLTIVGKDKHLNYFSALTAQLRLGAHVTFAGAQSDLLPFYAKADALVIPSLYDPCANVTLEALAMGLFVVTSPFNGASELLTSQSGCIVENIFDPQSIAAALKNAFEHTTPPHLIRESIKHLDFSAQLDKMVELTLHS